MKKVLALLVLAALAAAPASAISIKGSKHDLSTQNNSFVGIKVGDYNEICVYCHTPHGARTNTDGPNGENTLPLWNRSGSGVTFTAADLYNSTSLSTASVPSAVATSVQASDAPLCLSCHDGTTLADAVVNPPNSNAAGSGATGITLSAGANLSPDLTNDHPIGMVYATAAGLDGAANLHNPPTTTKIQFFPNPGAGGDKMWCSSCHDVHDPGTATLDGSVTQFMVTTMVGSELCLECHNK